MRSYLLLKSSVFLRFGHSVQDEPPSFAREGGAYKYSKAFKDIIDSCLIKDPALRPSAAELLDSSFFKSSKKKSYLVGAILSMHLFRFFNSHT